MKKTDWNKVSKETIIYIAEIETALELAIKLINLHHDCEVMGIEWGEACPACMGRLRGLYEAAVERVI